MRTNSFLVSKLEDFLQNQFADMQQANNITISFGRRAKRRFGSIRMERNKKESRITINGVFRKESIPEEIILATIAHELCHYAHGFCSPLAKKYDYPHQGGVVQRELRKRGLIHLHNYEKLWTKNNWIKILEAEFPGQRARLKRKRSVFGLSQKRRLVRRRISGQKGAALKLLMDLFKP